MAATPLRLAAERSAVAALIAAAVAETVPRATRCESFPGGTSSDQVPMASGDWEPDFSALVLRAGETAPAANQPAVPKTQPPDNGARFVPIDFSLDTEQGSVQEVSRGFVETAQPETVGLRAERAVSFESPDPFGRSAMVRSSIMGAGSPDVPTELGKYSSVGVHDDGRESSFVQSSALRPGSVNSATPAARRESIALEPEDEGIAPPQRHSIAPAKAVAGKRQEPPTEPGGGPEVAPKVAKIDQTIQDMRSAVFDGDDAYARKHQKVFVAAQKLLAHVPWEESLAGKFDPQKPVAAEMRKAGVLRAFVAKGASRLDSARLMLEKARVYVDAQFGASTPRLPGRRGVL